MQRILRIIWSATFLQVQNIDAVTGSFNVSLERAFIVFMDEALFVGDRRASDALKSAVTETVIMGSVPPLLLLLLMVMSGWLHRLS